MYIKSTPSAKNELGSMDSACRITTVFLQRITTSIDQTTRLSWPRYCKILFENLNSRHSNRSKFSRTENFFGPLRFLPNHQIFSSDTFDTANKMLDEMKQFEQQQDPISRRFSNIKKTSSGKISFKMCATYIKNKMFQAGGSKGNDPLEIVEELVLGKNIQQKDVCTSEKRHHT